MGTKVLLLWQPDLTGDLTGGASVLRRQVRAGRTPTGPLGHWSRVSREHTMRAMTKRVVAAMLWFYAGWYAGALLADFLGVSPLLGPLIGAAAAGLIAGDPRRIIWKPRTATASAATATEAAEPA